MKKQTISTDIKSTKEASKIKSQDMVNKGELECNITERVFSDGDNSLQDLLNIYFENAIEKILKNLYDEKEVRAISEKEVA